MLKQGIIVGERYEIIELIGSGGMADVYKAKDHKLNRFVAVKVLKQEFREDKTFVSKFRAEAQAAAGLSYPNIVNVYDVGDDSGIYYIVMELIEGITLKEYIDKKGKLTVKEAISIAIQVSMGLEAAHNNKIVHRDIKPQNIIISTDGKVKVADFGIAKAASANTISSNVMGSVHYSSPEQARGGYSDEKSDIYSLGITLYEMVTGVVPFDGETTVAIAIKHLQEEMVSPKSYTPDLPYSLEQIILKCTQKSADRRYVNVEEVIRDLKQSLVDPEGDFVQLVPLNNHAKTVMISKEELEQINNERNRIADVPEDEDDDDEDDDPEDGSDDEDDDDDEEDDDDDKYISPKLEKAMTIGGIIIAVIFIFLFIAIIANTMNWFNFGSSSNKETESESESESETSDLVEVPSLLGMTFEAAQKELNDLGVGIVKSADSPQPSSEYNEGLIMDQDIAKGEMVKRNETITVILSSGPEKVDVPNVVGEKESVAVSTISSKGLTPNVTMQYSDNVEEGYVIETSPKAGTSVNPGETVIIYVSNGPEETQSDTTPAVEVVTVPSVLNKDEATAKSDLLAAGLTVGTISTAYSDEVSEGNVVSQSVAGGTSVTKGQSVSLVISSGPKPQDTTTAKSYVCNMAIAQPATYNGGEVKIVLVQGAVSYTITEGTAVDFPYKIDYTLNSNASATIEISEKDENGDYIKIDSVTATIVEQ